MEPILIIPIILIAIVIDVLFGELPLIIHPVVFIGKIIDFFKNLKKNILYYTVKFLDDF